jgi:hypothetical protein
MLDEFTQAYIECALWSSTDEDGCPLDDNYSFEDIDKETSLQMVEDCGDFQYNNWDDVVDNPKRAGHDFWLTRNHHGAGFWDGDWSDEVGSKLTEYSHQAGSVDLYVGDDGKIYST